MPQNDKSTSYIKAQLLTQSDWDAWRHQFEKLAESKHLDGHVFRKEPLLPMPRPPRVADYPIKDNIDRTIRQDPVAAADDDVEEEDLEENAEQAQAGPANPRPANQRGRGRGRAGAASGTRSQGPAQQRPVQSGPLRPINFSDLTKEGQLAFQVDQTTYGTEEKLFREQDKGIQALKAWFFETVKPNWSTIASKNSSDLCDWYAELRTLVGITEAVKESNITLQYRNAIRPLTKFNDWLKWLDNWESVIALAQSEGLPETYSVYRWTLDFTNAVKPVAGNWASTYMDINADKINAKALKFGELANAFRILMTNRANESRKGRPGSITKGSFGPSYAGQETNPIEGSDDEEPDQSKDKGRAKGRGRARNRSAKRPRASKDSDDDVLTSQCTCEACDQRHPITECFYIYKNKAPKK